MSEAVPVEIVARLAEVGLRAPTPLGAGAYGVVVRAEDVGLARTVVAKLLPPLPESSRGRMARELKALAAVRHPHLVELLDVRQVGDAFVLVFPDEEGSSLRARLDAAPGRRLPSPAVARLGAEVASALAALHAARMVHRDVKPANIVLTPSGDARLIDLGLAGGQAFAEVLTATGHFLGTPAYAAPGPAAGEPAVPRDDVHALGVVLYEALVGTNPYAGEGPLAALEAVRRRELPPLAEAAPGTPEGLARAVESCLAKAIEARPEAAELAARLGHLAEGGDASNRPPGTREPKPRSRGYSPVWVAAALGAGLLAGVGPRGTSSVPAPARPEATLPAAPHPDPLEARLRSLARSYPRQPDAPAPIFEEQRIFVSPLHDPVRFQEAIGAIRGLGAIYAAAARGTTPADRQRRAALEDLARSLGLPALLEPFDGLRPLAAPTPAPRQLRGLLEDDLDEDQIPGVLDAGFAGAAIARLLEQGKALEDRNDRIEARELPPTTSPLVLLMVQRHDPAARILRLAGRVEETRPVAYAWMDEGHRRSWAALVGVARALQRGEAQAPLALLLLHRMGQRLEGFWVGRFARLEPELWTGPGLAPGDDARLRAFLAWARALTNDYLGEPQDAARAAQRRALATALEAPGGGVVLGALARRLRERLEELGGGNIAAGSP